MIAVYGTPVLNALVLLSAILWVALAASSALVSIRATHLPYLSPAARELAKWKRARGITLFVVSVSCLVVTVVIILYDPAVRFLPYFLPVGTFVAILDWMGRRSAMRAIADDQGEQSREWERIDAWLGSESAERPERDADAI